MTNSPMQPTTHAARATASSNTSLTAQDIENIVSYLLDIRNKQEIAFGSTASDRTTLIAGQPHKYRDTLIMGELAAQMLRQMGAFYINDGESHDIQRFYVDHEPSYTNPPSLSLEQCQFDLRRLPKSKLDLETYCDQAVAVVPANLNKSFDEFEEGNPTDEKEVAKHAALLKSELEKHITPFTLGRRELR